VASVLAWVRAARELMEGYPLASTWLDACLDRPAHRALRDQARQG
jgi:hypothetical protein